MSMHCVIFVISHAGTLPDLHPSFLDRTTAGEGVAIAVPRRTMGNSDARELISMNMGQGRIEAGLLFAIHPWSS